MKLRSSLMLAALLAGTATAHADPAVYTETVTASGTENGVSFANATVVFQTTADTSTAILARFGPPLLYVSYGTTTVTVSGITGIATVNSSNIAAVSGYDSPYANRYIFAIGDLGTGAGIGTADLGANQAYTLLSSFSVTALANLDSSKPIPTTAGPLVILQIASGSSSTFTSVVTASAPAPVPEPSSVALYAMGMLGLWSLRRATRA